MLAARRRLLPASVVVSAALAASLLGASGASAATADADIATATAPTATTTTTTTTNDVTPVTDTTSTQAVLSLSAVTTTSVTRTLTTTTATTATTTTALTYAQKMAVNRSQAVQIAKWQLPDRYVAGAVGPDAFDCSGLTRYVVRKAFGKTLPHYSKAQWSNTKRVYRSNIRPGDLVFFFRNGAHHVGMYIGNGKMVHAANPRRDVAVDYVWRGWYGDHYSGAGRIV